MLAIIRTGGKQYKVAPGDTITIEKLDQEDGKITFNEVLLVGGDKTVVGTPTVTGASVTADLVSNFRGEKIRVFKFKAKSHYSKTIGHRQDLTQVKITEIITDNKKETKVVTTKESKPKKEVVQEVANGS